jgi:uncharacterized protein (TIRG00374 family)
VKLINAMNKLNASKLISWNLVKILIAIVLCGYLLTQISITDLIEIRQSISLPWLLVSMTAFYAGVWALACRYWNLIDRKVPFRHTLNTVVLQTVIGNLLTPSAGAVSYVTILRKQYHIELRRGISSILLARIFDLVALGIGLVLSTMVLKSAIAQIQLVVFIIGGLISVFLFVFGLLIIYRIRVVLVLNRIVGELRLHRVNIVERILDETSSLASLDLDRFKKMFRGLLFSTLLIFLFNFIFSYTGFLSFSVHLELWPILFIVSISQLVSLVPIHILGGIGVVEITNLYLLSLFGFESSEIIPLLIGLRVFFYIINFLLAVYILIESRLNPAAHNVSLRVDPKNTIARLQEDEPLP